MSYCGKIFRTIQAKQIERDDLGKAKQFRLFSIARPHMRGFHASWFGFFVAFTSWFGIQPLLPTIRKEFGFSKKDLANSGTASVAATIAVRVVIGALCDRFGPRRAMAGLLISGAIPMALAGVINSATGLIVLRLFIGVLGGCFVPCQFWTSAMFSPKIVGTANAVVGGWGNLGGGFTFILMPGLFQLVKKCGAHEFLAWKIAVAIPAAICVITGIAILLTADDCPQGKWVNRKLPEARIVVELQENGNEDSQGTINEGFEPNGKSDEIVERTKPDQSTTKRDPEEKQRCSVSRCWSYFTVVILIIQYGMCFGVEIAVNTVMNLYLLYRFKEEGCDTRSTENTTLYNSTTQVQKNNDIDECSILDQNTASLITSLFGLMNLFARAMGGVYSDILRKHLKLAGRLLAHFTCLLGEGILLIVFSKMSTIPNAVGVMVIFSIFVQMSEGTTFSIVPYVAPRHVGVVAGLVGAGGNAGALIWNTIWAQLVDTNPSQWFLILGYSVLAGSSLTLLAYVQQEKIWDIFKCKASCEKEYKVNDSRL